MGKKKGLLWQKRVKNLLDRLFPFSRSLQWFVCLSWCMMYASHHSLPVRSSNEVIWRVVHCGKRQDKRTTMKTSAAVPPLLFLSWKRLSVDDLSHPSFALRFFLFFRGDLEEEKDWTPWTTSQRGPCCSWRRSSIGPGRSPNGPTPGEETSYLCQGLLSSNEFHHLLHNSLSLFLFRGLSVVFKCLFGFLSSLFPLF